MAAFDFDGTLTRGGSVFDFLVAVGGRRAWTAAVLDMPRLAYAAVAGGTAADTAKENLFERVLAGAEQGRVDRIAHAFALRLLERLRPEVRERLEWHRARGDAVLVVSASPEVYVAEIGRHLGADAVLATKLAIGENGELTGRYDGSNCRGVEKLRRLRRWMEQSGSGHAAPVGLRQQPRRPLDAPGRGHRGQRGPSRPPGAAGILSDAGPDRTRSGPGLPSERRDRGVGRRGPLSAPRG